MIQGMKALARYRKKADLSQSEMAVILGISQSMVALIETGDRKPGAQLARKIEFVTGISREKLRPDIFGEYKAA